MKTGRAVPVPRPPVPPALNAGRSPPRGLLVGLSAPTATVRRRSTGVEGFIRQILAGREYVRGLYWARMPAYRDTNALGARRDLPWFYWSGKRR